jgi:putative membrane protein
MLMRYANRLIRDVAAWLGLLVLVIVFPERASSSPATTPLSARDRAFLEDAALANLSQTQFGQIAIKRAVDPQVRAFATRNLSDYSRIRDALSSVATADQAPLPDHLNGEAQRDYLG